MEFQLPQFKFDTTVDECLVSFAEKWASVSYEGEAIGLMHTASSFMGTSNQELELEIIKFFVFYSALPTHVVSEKYRSDPPKHLYVFKAQELLFGKVIPNWNSLRAFGSEDAHAALLNLILKPTQPLIRAPFHGHVSTYLLHFQDLVEHGNFYSRFREPDEKTCSNEVQHLFSLYVNAMINWEFADELINTRHPLNFHRTNDIQRILERYFESQSVSISYLFSVMTHPGRSFTPVEKRHGYPTEWDIQVCVFLALMTIQYLVKRVPVVPPRKGLFD